MAQAKTSELTGAALDWVVAKCDEDSFLYENIHFGGKALGIIYDHPNGYLQKYCPSSSWAQGGPIIEREGINTRTLTGWGGKMKWQADINDSGALYYGETALIAAMHCYVASKLGDVVEIPDELC